MSISPKRSVFCVLFAIVVLLLTVSWLYSNNDVKETQALQIFLDQALTTPYVGQFLWGEAHVGSNNFTLWLKNNSPHFLEYLSLIPPPLPLNCTPVWNLQNHTLRPYEIKEATLTLFVPTSLDIEDIIRFRGRFEIVYFIEK